MLVYRLEHKELPVGPYRFEHSFQDELLEAHTDRNHPPADIFDDSFVCGFDDKKKLYRWFSGYVRRLKKEGFEVCVFSVPNEWVDTDQPGLQLIFNREEAKIVL